MLRRLRFHPDQVRPSLLNGDEGDAFQRFVHELLGDDYPGLHLYSTRGKDGGIDLRHQDDSSRKVFECKYIGQDGLAAAAQRWGEVERNLRRNLVNDSGRGREKQYDPWLSPNFPITEYLFITSSLLKHEAEWEDLRSRITATFREIAEGNERAQHLRNVTVNILDWSDLEMRMRMRPIVALRWFPQLTPSGFAPLDDARPAEGFRAYLTEATLPFYSRSSHLKVASLPRHAAILDEAKLLDELQDGRIEGLVLTGGGGVGKTRLMLELGRLAADKGWLVLRARNRLKPDAIESLVEMIAAPVTVLLLIDYIETQQDFATLADEITARNDTLIAEGAEKAVPRFRYVANCRTSFYQEVIGTPRHRRVDLTPVMSRPDEEWLVGYRHATVRHILRYAGLDASDRYFELCRNTPILAVFLSFLKAAGRNAELEELLGADDFGSWVVNRLRASFRSNPIDRPLAQLMAFFPLSIMGVSRLGQTQRELFDRLRTDEWILREAVEGEGDERWVTVHDVLADQILLYHVREWERQSADLFTAELMESAVTVDALRSVLLALQRLIDHQPFGALAWFDLLTERIAAAPAAWAAVRDLLVRTSLLSPEERIDLLASAHDVWIGSESEPAIQLAVGWLARWAKQAQWTALTPKSQVLHIWLQAAVPYMHASNYPLTSALRLFPQAFRDSAIQWILAHPLLFQTHFLLVEWLQHFPANEVADAVRTWADRFAISPNLSFLVRAWLGAGGATESLRPAIKAWLREHATTPEAQFVYAAWLNAKGEPEMVRADVRAWLKEHATTPVARFVYAAWLNAKGEPEMMRAGVEAWLKEHATTPEASFVYQAWMEATEEPAVVRASVEAWLKEHATISDAQFVYTAWLNAKGEPEMVRADVRAWLKEHATTPETSFVYAAWLNAKGEPEMVRAGVEAWLKEHATTPEANFVYWAWLDAKGEPEIVRAGVEAWSRIHALALNADFVYRSWLEAGGDFAVIAEGASAWMHANRERPEAVYLTKCLAKESAISSAVVRDILYWCRHLRHDMDASSRLWYLHRHFDNPAVAPDLLHTLACFVELGGSQAIVAGTDPAMRISMCFSYLFSLELFAAPPYRPPLDRLFADWLRNPASFAGEVPEPLFHDLIAERFGFLLFLRILDAERDRESIERFLRTSVTWPREGRVALFRILQALASRGILLDRGLIKLSAPKTE